MWNQKIGLSIGNKYPIPTADVIRLLAQIGFDAISPAWSADENFSEMMISAADCGLTVQSLHAPFTKAADMWSDDPSRSDDALSEHLRALESCHRFQLPIMVVHTWIGFDYTFGETKHGFQNFDVLVNRAAQCKVKIAFENTEGEEYLFALMEHFRDNDTVGFCWDSGHELCYNHSNDLLNEFGDRLLITHLNDNLGISRFDGKTIWTDDLHLLPYDGIADWDDNISRLKRSKPQDILNFELARGSKPGRHENDRYGQMSLEEYFTEAYKRACRIAYRYAR